jgi:hypothetical protein
MFQTARDIFFHLAIAVSSDLILMTHPKSLQGNMDAILSDPGQPASVESMKPQRHRFPPRRNRRREARKIDIDTGMASLLILA